MGLLVYIFSFVVWVLMLVLLTLMRWERGLGCIGVVDFLIVVWVECDFWVLLLLLLWFTFDCISLWVVSCYTSCLLGWCFGILLSLYCFTYFELVLHTCLVCSGSYAQLDMLVVM